MNNSRKSKAFLSIDLGPVATRATFFDRVDGKYRFIAMGSSLTTLGEQYRVSSYTAEAGVLLAIQKLQNVLERNFVGANGEHLFTGSLSVGFNEQSGERGSCVDPALIAVSSLMPMLNVVLVALSDVSLESLKNLASLFYQDRLEVIQPGDGKNLGERLEVLLRFKPEIVLVAGGFDVLEPPGSGPITFPGGWSDEVLTGDREHSPLLELVQTVSIASQILPDQDRPMVLYAGSSALRKRVQSIFNEDDRLWLAENIRPSLRQERLEDATTRLIRLLNQVQINKGPFKGRFITRADVEWVPSPIALKQAVGVLSEASPSDRCVLAVDSGAFETTLTIGCNGQIKQGSFSLFAAVNGFEDIFSRLPVDEIYRWSGLTLSKKRVMEYVYNRMINPLCVPSTREDLSIEHAIARSVMQQAVRSFQLHERIGSNCAIEPLIVSGRLVEYDADFAQIMLLFLDGLQPTGITTMILDTLNILPSLGAIASQNGEVIHQVLSSTSFQHLGTVVSPVDTRGRLRAGNPVLRLKMDLDDDPSGRNQQGSNTLVKDILQGSLTVFPLAEGRPAHLHLQPLRGVDIGMGGPGKGGKLHIRGGKFGLVIDARGRPLELPADPKHRQSVLHQWHRNLAG